MYNTSHLNALKSCFYQELNNDEENLNIGLNVFFGNEPNNDEKWIESFKERIIQLTEKRSESEKVTITRTKISQNNFENIEPKTIIQEGRKKWIKIKDLLSNFLTNLKEKLGSEELLQTLIYEAPPYKITYNTDNESIEFAASFIFDDNCSSAYAQSIKDWADDSKNPSEILANRKTGFFDIIPIPIPINSELRTLWATDDKFLIEGKRIFIHFFEWAFEDYLLRLKNSNIEVSKNHKVAIGIPLNNAVTLYEYYELKKTNTIDFLSNLLTTNDFQNKNKNYTGLWLQHYKSSIISPGNKPIGKLIENAFS